MSTIAKAAVLLSTNNQQLYKGLDEAKTRTENFVKNVGNMPGPNLPKPKDKDSKGWMAGFAGGLAGSLVSTLTSSLQQGFSGQLVGSVIGGALGSAIGFLGGPIGALGGGIAGGLIGSISDTLQNGILALGKEIDQGLALGFGPDTFTGLTAAFADFGLQGQEGLAVFNRLNQSAKSLKLNPQLQFDGRDAILSAATVEERFYAAADAIRNAGDEAQRAAIGQQLFGEASARILPYLSQGSEGLKAMVQDKLAFGQAMQKDDAAKILSARNAIINVGDSLQGMWRTILAAASPVIEFVSNGLTEWIRWMTEVVPWTEIIQGGFKTIGVAASYVIDVVKLIGEVGAIAFQGIWDTLKALADSVMQFVNGALKVLAQVFGDIFDIAKQMGLTLLNVTFDPKTAKQIEAAFGRFGNTAKEFNKSFDALLNKKWDKPAIGVIKEELTVKPIQYQPVAAVTEGSKEAASIKARFKFQGLIAPKQDQQLAEAKKANGLLQQVKELLADMGKEKGLELGVL